MNERKGMRLTSLLRFAAALALGTYSVSNLMPLILHTALRGLDLAGGIWIVGYLLLTSLSIGILARMIYTMDKKAGRIRNKISCFE
jgi:hypothetical protein